jgi:glutamate-1-semialdehyde 2,1-aminomutase
VYETLESRSAALATGLKQAADAAGVPLVVNRVGSMLTPFFVKTGATVANFAQATACDAGVYAEFFHAMLESGVFMAPSQFEALFVGLAHGEEQIAQTIAAAAPALATVRQSRGKKK